MPHHIPHALHGRGPYLPVVRSSSPYAIAVPSLVPVLVSQDQGEGYATSPKGTDPIRLLFPPVGAFSHC